MSSVIFRQKVYGVPVLTENFKGNKSILQNKWEGFMGDALHHPMTPAVITKGNKFGIKDMTNHPKRPKIK